jgi:hypothetical protein
VVTDLWSYCGAPDNGEFFMWALLAGFGVAALVAFLVIVAWRFFFTTVYDGPEARYLGDSFSDEERLVDSGGPGPVVHQRADDLERGVRGACCHSALAVSVPVGVLHMHENGVRESEILPPLVEANALLARGRTGAAAECFAEAAVLFPEGSARRLELEARLETVVELDQIVREEQAVAVLVDSPLSAERGPVFPNASYDCQAAEVESKIGGSPLSVEREPPEGAAAACVDPEAEAEAEAEGLEAGAEAEVGVRAEAEAEAEVEVEVEAEAEAETALEAVVGEAEAEEEGPDAGPEPAKEQAEEGEPPDEPGPEPVQTNGVPMAGVSLARPGHAP